MKAYQLLQVIALVDPEAEVRLATELVTRHGEPWVRDARPASALVLHIGGRLALVLVPADAVDALLDAVPDAP